VSYNGGRITPDNVVLLTVAVTRPARQLGLRLGFIDLRLVGGPVHVVQVEEHA